MLVLCRHGHDISLGSSHTKHALLLIKMYFKIFFSWTFSDSSRVHPFSCYSEDRLRE